MHRHRVKSSHTVAFMGAVRAPQNRAAHGNITVVDTCACGAERRTNRNGGHVERGAWDESLGMNRDGEWT